MTSPHDPLFRRIDEFAIDDGTPALTFADRLARENGWTKAYTERVLREYKRFVYLTQVADHLVVPSEEVDQRPGIPGKDAKSSGSQSSAVTARKPYGSARRSSWARKPLGATCWNGGPWAPWARAWPGPRRMPSWRPPCSIRERSSGAT